jgi:hypothetical protein
MEKNLITEIHRISELIGIENKFTLNESALGSLFKNVAETEILSILRAEVQAAMKGVGVISKQGKVYSSVERAAQKSVIINRHPKKRY